MYVCVCMGDVCSTDDENDITKNHACMYVCMYVCSISFNDNNVKQECAVNVLVISVTPPMDQSTDIHAHEYTYVHTHYTQ